jgi:hypothetical protein
LDVSYGNKLLSKTCSTKYLRIYTDSTVWENSYQTKYKLSAAYYDIRLVKPFASQEILKIV